MWQLGSLRYAPPARAVADTVRGLRSLGVAVEVDSREWHLSPEDHAATLARGRRMAVHQINVLRFTPRQIRTTPAQVVAEIAAALHGARGRPPLNLRTVSRDPVSRDPVSRDPVS